jgi:hypothetical protein
MPGPTYLAALSDAARNLVLAVLILSALTAILLRAANELGVRAAVQHRWVDAWFSRRAALSPGVAGDIDEIRRHLAKIGTRQDVYSLDYRQICGLVAAAIQAHLTYPKGDSPFLTAIAAHADADDLGLLRTQRDGGMRDEVCEAGPIVAARQRVAYHAEKGLDDLQASLGRSWARLTYDLALSVSFGLTSALSAVLPLDGLGSRVVALGLMIPSALYFLAALHEAGRLHLPFAAALRAVLPALFVALLLLTPLLRLDPALHTLEIMALIGYAGGLLTPVVGSLLDRVHTTR